MNLDEKCPCPECGNPMDVMLPIWVTPGEESIDTSTIVWESDMPKCSSNWWCPECESHHFPVDNEENVPCAACGRNDLPLHTDYKCPNCH